MTVPMYPAWLPDPKSYEIEQERFRHDQSLWFYGEYAMFVLMWRIEDHENDLVERCGKCYIAYGKIAEVYGQPAKEKCDSCYGTTFEGGVKAKIVRPSLWDTNEGLERERERGEVEIRTASIQSTNDFRLRNHDYIFRGDGTRWMVQSISTNHLRSGFDMPTQADTPLGYNFSEVVLQDDSTVAYMIPPDEATLMTIDLPGQRYPTDWSTIEEINGSLL